MEYRLVYRFGVTSGQITIEGQVPKLIATYEFGFFYEVIASALFIAPAVYLWWASIEPPLAFLVCWILGILALSSGVAFFTVRWFEKRLKQAVRDLS